MLFAELSQAHVAFFLGGWGGGGFAISSDGLFITCILHLLAPTLDSNRTDI